MMQSCSDADQHRDRPPNPLADTLAGMTESNNPHIEIIAGNRVRVSATAPRGVTRESANLNRTDLFGPPVEITVFDSLGHVETHITANQASFLSRQYLFEFIGDVDVHTGEQRRLRTEQLTWDEIGSRFTSNGFVIITTPEDSITGYGLVGDQDLTQYRLNRVTGQFRIND
ncbi:MAG: LPS export ABC transporter periplasmic protein LptC [Candidatus Cyclonatronum sp.]|uniref:LPS export ABC transporter periplasmic protein LptC n=1 Tax=Cyclonatronum sp. TaxID=3024185 RepID=UPI0025B8C95A|nr:LPS export ABC transporter periplasmic protein LptC [Cyclonatronum sp.]MCC5933071.1 LPS export ABC transporter periplasmic protein LptC [Balneolales bacterium]MCH8485745.1 LPS export ABC transporter periplasmic protein LptC [Cyclonatronum sp.]